MSCEIDFVKRPIFFDLDALLVDVVRTVSISFKRLVGGLKTSLLSCSADGGQVGCGLSLNLSCILVRMIFATFDIILSGS